jgi:hypothetical protein
MQSQAQSAVDLRALQALARSVALPSLCGMGGLRGWGSWRAPEFWAGKSCTFRKSRKDFLTPPVPIVRLGTLACLGPAPVARPLLLVAAAQLVVVAAAQERKRRRQGNTMPAREQL